MTHRRLPLPSRFKVVALRHLCYACSINRKHNNACKRVPRGNEFTSAWPLPLTTAKDRNTHIRSQTYYSSQKIRHGRATMVFIIMYRQKIHGTSHRNHTFSPLGFCMQNDTMNLAFSINGKQYKHLHRRRTNRITFAVETLQVSPGNHV